MILRGRPSWYKPDVGLASRMVLTMFLLGLVYVVFGVVIGAIMIHYGVSLFFLIAFALIIAGAQFFFSDKIALAAMGARYVDEADAPELHALVERLAVQANLPKPRIAVINSSMPNAFATGRNAKNATIAVTTGIYNQLSTPELEAVLAHELTHIINHDMLVMTIASFFSILIGLLARNLMWMGFWGGFGGGFGRRRGNDNLGALIAISLLVSVVVYAISFLLIRALSRARELAADRGSALITGAPENLASALLRISDRMPHIPEQDFRQAQAVNALFIVPAIKGDSFMELLSTHPSIEERVARLEEMQRQMERGPH